MTTQPGELALHMERDSPASRSRVFAALTKPEELAKRWGPRGFTAPSTEIDLRVGGSYRIAMQPPKADLYAERRRALHERGWTDGLDRLQELISQPSRRPS